MNRNELLTVMGLIDPKNPLDAEATMLALQSFTDEQIKAALVWHKQNSPYPMKVCDVVSFWKMKSRQNSEALEQKAALIYERFFKYPKTGYDHVTTDKRAVYAFRVAFGTLAEYGSRTSFIDGIDKRDFVKAYVNALPDDYELAGNVIEGRNHNSNASNPTVVCMDGPAKAIALRLYGKAVNIAGISYSTNTKAVAYKPKPKELPLSQEQRAETREKVIALLSGYLKVARGS